MISIEDLIRKTGREPGGICRFNPIFKIWPQRFEFEPPGLGVFDPERLARIRASSMIADGLMGMIYGSIPGQKDRVKGLRTRYERKKPGDRVWTVQWAKDTKWFRYNQQPRYTKEYLAKLIPEARKYFRTTAQRTRSSLTSTRYRLRERRRT